MLTSERVRTFRMEVLQDVYMKKWLITTASNEYNEYKTYEKTNTDMRL